MFCQLAVVAHQCYAYAHQPHNDGAGDDWSRFALMSGVCFVQAVSRGARTPLVVGDMPFGSYEVSPEEALRTSIRFVKVTARESGGRMPQCH